ncbi:MAG: inorganic pyrophosphatase [Deltaproteobacteria bacterium]|nr:inorganic pyrophosphatase [Deltaproteobacteria bacterium]
MKAPLYRAHPWHGLSAGDGAPELVTCFIEIVPTDTVKYEIDKASGHLKVDRPQKYSNLCPMPYGFVPQTLCDTLVAERAIEVTGRQGPGEVIRGDQDPLDICVLAERPINHGGILLTARVIGGFCMLDRKDETPEADDKIIAVLKDDAAFGTIEDIAQAPPALIERLRHYFLTYKEIPESQGPPRCEISRVYDRAHALDVIRRAQRDYAARFG